MGNKIEIRVPDIDFAIEFYEWAEKLTPRDKVSVWSKDGQGSGLFNMDSEQLMRRFLSERNKLKQ